MCPWWKQETDVRCDHWHPPANARKRNWSDDVWNKLPLRSQESEIKATCTNSDQWNHKTRRQGWRNCSSLLRRTHYSHTFHVHDNVVQNSQPKEVDWRQILLIALWNYNGKVYK